MRHLYYIRNLIAGSATTLVDSYMMTTMGLNSIEGRARRAEWMVTHPYPYQYAKIKERENGRPTVSCNVGLEQMLRTTTAEIHWALSK